MRRTALMRATTPWPDAASYHVFHGWAIARPATTDDAAVQRRLLQVALDDVLHCFAGPRDPAWDLTRAVDALVEGEAELLRVAVLALDLAPIHGPTIDAGWRTGLEARYCKSCISNNLRHLNGWRVAGASGGNLSIGAEVNPATQECPGRDDDGARGKPPPI